MSYMHINNLYKNKTMILFKQVFAAEKIHGTSSWISWKNKQLRFFAGGIKHELFISLFNAEELIAKFIEYMGDMPCVIYGEAYGGKCQGMSSVYGNTTKFVAFEVQINDIWLNVTKAEKVVKDFGLEFVPYEIISNDADQINNERDRESVQAIRNGMGTGLPREGIVLRPLEEFRDNNGDRVIAKFKSDAFAERVHPPKVYDPDKQIVLANAEAIADEWATAMRLEHVLQLFPEPHINEIIGKVIEAMIIDISREAKGEIIDSKAAQRAVGKRTALMFKKRQRALEQKPLEVKNGQEKEGSKGNILLG